MKCNCGSKLFEFNGFSRTVIYCEDCSFFKVENKECEHESIPVKMMISNGAIQLRLLCKNCFFLDPKPKKLADYPNVKMERSLEKLNNYKLIQETPTEEFIKRLRDNKHLAFREDYEIYINSEAWKEKRKQILFRDNYQCQICFSKATDVHHLTYYHFKNEYDFELISLCNKCHINEYHTKAEIQP
jgi:hypothetical protein